MNIDILHRPTALENLLAGRIWPADRRLPMYDLYDQNGDALAGFKYFCLYKYFNHKHKKSEQNERSSLKCIVENL